MQYRSGYAQAGRVTPTHNSGAPVASFLAGPAFISTKGSQCISAAAKESSSLLQYMSKRPDSGFHFIQTGSLECHPVTLVSIV